MTYAFVLGRSPELSVAELGAFFGETIAWKPGAPAAFFDGDLPAKTPQEFLNRLGGTVEILEIFESRMMQGDVLAAIEKFLTEACLMCSGKCPFGVNLVPENRKSQALKFLLPRLKRNLRTAGIAANFMNKNFQNVSGVLAAKQDLVKRKTSISIVDIGGNETALGFSAALQDFESYAKRDYGKPFRDAQAGMLPPKLAQIMVNLVLHAEPVTMSLSKGDGWQAPLILDPFCGTGTILMEAMLAGHSVIGSDVDDRLVEGAQNNIEWLRKNFRVPPSVTASVSRQDAGRLNAAPYGAIVTEPHLGPPLIQSPHESFLLRLKAELETLYLKFFKNLAGWLNRGTPVVFIFPYWKKNGPEKNRLADGLVEKIEPLGYSKTTFIPLQTASLFYDRADQIVGREIIRFIKK